MYYFLGLILVTAAVLADKKEDSKLACARSQVSSRSRDYDEGDTLIEAHKKAMDEIPKAYKKGSPAQYSKIKLDVMRVKKGNKTFTVKRVVGFDEAEKSRLNVEYSVFNADKSTIVNILPAGTFDGLIKTCREVKHFKKMFGYYYNTAPMLAPAPLGNVVYMDPLRSQVLTPSLSFPQYSVSGGVLSPSWASPSWSDFLVPFGPDNANANARNGNSMMGQPALGMSQQVGASPGFGQVGGSTSILGQGQSNTGIEMNGPTAGFVGQPGGFGGGAMNGGSGHIVMPMPNNGYASSGQTGYLSGSGVVKTGHDHGQSKTFDNNNMIRPWDKGGVNPPPQPTRPSTWGQSRSGRVNHLTDGDGKP